MRLSVRGGAKSENLGESPISVGNSRAGGLFSEPSPPTSSLRAGECCAVFCPLPAAGGRGAEEVKCDKKTNYPVGGFTNRGFFDILPEETNL